MAQFKEKAFQILEDAYLKIMSEPTFDFGPEKMKDRADAIHEIALKMLKMEVVLWLMKMQNWRKSLLLDQLQKQ